MAKVKQMQRKDIELVSAIGTTDTFLKEREPRPDTNHAVSPDEITALAVDVKHVCASKVRPRPSTIAKVRKQISCGAQQKRATWRQAISRHQRQLC